MDSLASEADITPGRELGGVEVEVVGSAEGDEEATAGDDDGAGDG